MAVIVRMRLFIALLVGPLIAITGTTGRWQVTALVLAAAAAARATRAAHRPIRTV
jgi:UDP-N-acetylmuramoylalanine-D-glutamate ligase